MTPHHVTATSPASRTSAHPGAAASHQAAAAASHQASEAGPSGAPGAAFEACCLGYRSELYAAALRMTREPADAHDLVQETLLRAYQAWSRFEPGTNCRAWLLRILTNAFINIYRKRRRQRRFASENRGDMLAAIYGEADDRAPSPEDAVLDVTLADEVATALDSLHEDYRKVVELADLQDVRYRDIADTLGVPVGTVMSRLFRARRRLEQQLEGFAADGYGIRRAA